MKASTTESKVSEHSANLNKPETKFRAGAISATVWQNQGQNKEGESYNYRTISLDRNYKDKEGNWKSTNSFRVADLPKAALVLSKAYEQLVIKDNNNAVEEVVM